MSVRRIFADLRAGVAAILGTAALLSPTTGLAQGVSSDRPRASQQTTESYWTPQRLRSAKPLDLHAVTGQDGLPRAAASSSPTEGKSQRSPGAAPLVTGTENRLLFVPPTAKPGQAPGQAPVDAAVAPLATSSYGAHYTTARDPAPTAYPSSTVGQLYFHDPRTGGNYVCSASVLRPRIVMTAGHCIAHPSTDSAQRYFYTGHYFVPALTSGVAPYGTWYPTQLWVTNTWYFSDGSVPNAADEGIFVANDRNIYGNIYKIGSRVGYLGYATYAISNNNLTMKGYPCNLDSCSRMESTNAQTYAYGGNNTYTYGSAMRGGASGGPWVQDFGIAPVSNPAVALGGNYLAAVTSYGPTATEPAYLGGSQFDGTFINLLNAACGGAAGNC